MANKEQYNLLKKCSDKRDLTEWNRYRSENPNEKINLRFANLERFYLVGANLRNADLRLANFQFTNFEISDIENAKIFNLKSYILLIFLLVSFVIILDVGYYVNHISFIRDVLFSLVIVSMAISFISILWFSVEEKLNFLLLFLFNISILYLFFLILIEPFFTNSFQTKTLVIFLILIIISIITSYFVIKTFINNEKTIANAKNPEKAIGFNLKYLKNRTTTQEEVLTQRVEELKKQELNESNKLKLKELEDELKKVKEDREISQTQQAIVETTIKHIESPYLYANDLIDRMNRHIYIYYGVIALAISIILYTIAFIHPQKYEYIKIVIETKPSFGALFGLVIAYSTPILFAFSIIGVAINQINKKINLIYELEEQKRFIETLKGTLKARTELGISSDELKKEIEKTINKLNDKVLSEFGKNENNKEENEVKFNYQHKIVYKQLGNFLTTLLRSKY